MVCCQYFGSGVYACTDITTSTSITGKTSKGEKRFLGSSGKINDNGSTYAKRGFKYQVGFRVIRTVKQ